MKNNEFSVKYHDTSAKAVKEASKNDGLLAVSITTYFNETKHSIDYVSFKGLHIDDYPYSLGSNQSIELVD